MPQLFKQFHRREGLSGGFIYLKLEMLQSFVKLEEAVKHLT